MSTVEVNGANKILAALASAQFDYTSDAIGGFSASNYAEGSDGLFYVTGIAPVSGLTELATYYIGDPFGTVSTAA